MNAPQQTSYAPGSRVRIRGEEAIEQVQPVSPKLGGGSALHVQGFTALVRHHKAIFLERVDSIDTLRPEDTHLVPDAAPGYRQSRLFLETLAALALGLIIDERSTIYRTQSPVLREYEQNTWYDKNGRIVFTVNPGLPGVGHDRKTFEAWQEALAQGAPPPEGADPTRYTPPFETRDREAEMRHAYAALLEAL